MPEHVPVPEVDMAALARAALRQALEAQGSSTRRIPVSAEMARQLARKRVRIALATLPLFVVTGVAALVVSLSLMLVAVVCGFFAFACIQVARGSRRAARGASDLLLTLQGDELEVPGLGRRKIYRAIDRADYLRLVFTPARVVVSFWLDNRRDTSAFFDLPGPRSSRRAVCDALRIEGIRVRTEGSTARVLLLAGALAAALLLLVAHKAALDMLAMLLALAVVGSPAVWLLLAGGLVALWLGLMGRA